MQRNVIQSSEYTTTSKTLPPTTVIRRGIWHNVHLGQILNNMYTPVEGMALHRHNFDLECIINIQLELFASLCIFFT